MASTSRSAFMFLRGRCRAHGFATTPGLACREFSSLPGSTQLRSSLTVVDHPRLRVATNTHSSVFVKGVQVGLRWKHKGRIGNRLETLKEGLLEEQHENAKGGQKSKAKKGNNNINTVDEGGSNDEAMAAFDAGLHHEDDDDGDNTGEDEDAGPQLPDMTLLKTKMSRVVTHLEKSLKSVRGGEPTPEMFENLSVMAYGTPTPLSSVAQVIIVSPTLAKCTCFDPENGKAVRDAIRDGGLNLNPRIDDSASGEVVVPVPKVSAETRKLLTKQIGKMGEASRTKIRNLRRRAHDICKKGQAGKLDHISKDDAFRVSKEVEAATEEMIKGVDGVVDEKQASVLTL